MTEQEAMIRLDFIRCALLGGTKPEIIPNEDNVELMDIAIKALEEIQKYREIGTVEECREAVEKQKKVKPTIINNGIMLNFKCPRCGIERLVGRNVREDYCGGCGQLWDWSDEE